MKPFDLEAALRGEPVVTRDGSPVTQIIKLDAPNDNFCVCAVAEGMVHTFTVTGSCLNNIESRYDLFMAEKPKVKRQGWVNLYNDEYCENRPYLTGKIFATQDEAKMGACEDCVCQIKIEWEEEA